MKGTQNLQSLSVASPAIHELPISPARKHHILELPLEIQICILSELPITGQIFASLVCTAWEDIIVNSQSFQKNRYHTSSERGYESRHRLRTHPGGLLCHVQSGIVKRFEFPLREGVADDFPLDYHQYDSTILTVERADVTRSKLLDEPLFSPFCDTGTTIVEDSMAMVGPCNCRRGVFSCGSGFPKSVPRNTTIRDFVIAIASTKPHQGTKQVDEDENLMNIDMGCGSNTAYDNDFPHRLVMRTIGVEAKRPQEWIKTRVWNEIILYLHEGSHPLDCSAFS